MRFHELRIETRRERPARARSEGESLLIRAGYLDVQGRSTELGRLALLRLEQHIGRSADWAATLGLAVIVTSEDETVAEMAGGDFRMMRCPACGYASGLETAAFRKTLAVSETPLPLERIHTPGRNTIESLSEFLGLPRARTAKAMLYWRSSDQRLIFVIIRGDMELSEEKLRRALGPLQPATEDQIAAAGAVPGYASPVGLRSATVIVDDAIPNSPNLVAGANEMDYHLRNTNHGRDFSADQVVDLALARAGDACPHCGSPLEAARGLLLASRTGMHYPAILLTAAEQNRDDQGLVMPSGAAPFDVHVLHLPARELDTRRSAALIHDELAAAGCRVLLDDRDERAGVKFNDADLIGCPVRVTVGEKHLGNRMVELKRRAEPSSTLIAADQVVERLRSEIDFPE